MVGGVRRLKLKTNKKTTGKAKLVPGTTSSHK